MSIPKRGELWEIGNSYVRGSQGTKWYDEEIVLILKKTIGITKTGYQVLDSTGSLRNVNSIQFLRRIN